jgi:hypothetical protein
LTAEKRNHEIKGTDAEETRQEEMEQNKLHRHTLRCMLPGRRGYKRDRTIAFSIGMEFVKAAYLIRTID